MQNSVLNYTKSMRKIDFNIKNQIFILLFISFISKTAFAQNSMIGDGFGGRLWYKPYNYLAGGYSAYTICEDSSKLLGWGNNLAGELGISFNPSGTTQPVNGYNLNNIRFVSAGFLSAGAIKNDGSGWVWGYIGGVNCVAKKIISDAKFARAGSGICVFVKNDGTVWSTGLNINGGFGNGSITTNNKYTLTLEKMLVIKTAVRVAVSENTTTILLSDGTVMSAGTNINGCLGNNSYLNTQALTPVNVIGLKDIVDIKACDNNIIALDKYGDVYAWGDAIGLGIANSKIAYVPKKIPSLKNIVAISSSMPGRHFLALDSNHNCYGWGDNSKGQLGDTNIFYFNTPTLIATGVNDINAARTFSYIIKTDGTLWAIGSSNYGSIWLDQTNIKRGQFTKLNPEDPMINLCKPSVFKPRTINVNSVTICNGDTFKIGNKRYHLNGIYKDTFAGIYGSDSILLTQLTILQPSQFSQTIQLCQGETISIKKRVYSIPGIYYDTFSNYRGCDSILTTYLKINSPLPFNQNISICNGSFYSIGKNKYTNTGIFKDTITSYLGCDSVVISNITIKPSPIFKQTISICEGSYYAIGNHVYKNTGVYTDTISNPFGCDSIVYTTLLQNPKPKADFYFLNKTPYMNDTVVFYNTSHGATRYQWRFDLPNNDGSIKEKPTYRYLSDGKKYVQLIAIDTFTNCSDTLTKTIEIKENLVIYIPSAFTPNGDGLNDYFFPVTNNFNRLHVKIFNRWGEVVFESNDFYPGWDGQYKEVLCMKGMYSYFMEFSNTFNLKKQAVTGIILLE